MSNVDFFNFDSLMANNANPFDEAKGYETDTRFYTLSKDKNGNGAAIIAFLPDPENKIFQRVYKINSNNTVNGKRRFLNTFSPTTIGAPDPFQERWQKLYNAGQKDEARKFSRAVRYITNIKIIKDVANPENEGKIFLYELSQTIYSKLKDALYPDQDNLGLSSERKEVYNPFSGYVFKLIAKKSPTGMTSYDSSEFVKTNDSIYKDKEEAINDIQNNGHKLSWFLDLNNYLSYEELSKKLKFIMNEDTNSDTIVVKEKTQDTQEINEATGVIQKSEHKTISELPQVKEASDTPHKQNDNNAMDVDAIIDELMF